MTEVIYEMDSFSPLHRNSPSNSICANSLSDPKIVSPTVIEIFEGQTYHINFRISDGEDNNMDSAAFIQPGTGIEPMDGDMDGVLDYLDDCPDSDPVEYYEGFEN